MIGFGQTGEDGMTETVLRMRPVNGIYRGRSGRLRSINSLSELNLLESSNKLSRTFQMESGVSISCDFGKAAAATYYVHTSDPMETVWWEYTFECPLYSDA